MSATVATAGGRRYGPLMGAVLQPVLRA